ncbi:MAG: amino acid--[acyl-carrier-protein] ligase [Caulobacteraceae bacterium]|nr:amino acid--[acyl-carrier-protein] ligase [Caulobacteraceae bacterium]
MTNTPTLTQIEQALFRPMGVDGVRARTGLHEGVLEALAHLISRRRPEEAETFRFPPVMSRKHIETNGYLKSFPNLLACACCLDGSESDIRRSVNRFVEGEAWTDDLAASDLVLTPASCYPIYPIAAAQGHVPDDGYVFDVGCDCFRREPSRDLDRLQSFRMREFVRIGTAEQVGAFRQTWLAKAQALADDLGLSYTLDVANDPFFGRGAAFLAASQREQALKFELLVPVISTEKPTACMSFNYHQDHFGQTWDLKLANGEAAHTGCVAFGMDRLTIALFVTHGLDVKQWPASIRAALQL